MPRYKLTIEYDGTPYVGWQRQDNGESVQEVMETAIAAFCGDKTGLRGAGRTDTGVHALGQVAHIDLSRQWPTDTIRDAVNAHLRPAPVAILAVEAVADDFDARFSATARHYIYRIVNRRAPLALDKGRVWRVAKPVDAEAMHDAAQVLVGLHDFTTFRSTECQAKSPVKTLDVLDVHRDGEAIDIRASARSFMHNQVRSMVGSLVQVGVGRWTRADLKDALEACDRTRCGPVAPPEGLYLARVDY